MDKKIEEIIQFSGLGQFIDTPIKYYSKGMTTRLGFSAAAFLDPEILFLDEVLSGGDMEFQKRCLGKMQEMAGGDRTIIFVSHSLQAVRKMCEQVLWIEDGEVRDFGDADRVCQAYARLTMGLSSEADREPGQAGRPKKPDQLEREISTQKSAPTDSQSRAVRGAKLLSVQVLDASEDDKVIFDREENIRVHIRFRIDRSDIGLVPVAHLHKDGIHIFSSHPEKPVRGPVGSEIDSMVEIPAKSLNVGEYSLSVAVVTPARPKWRHDFWEEALTFLVWEKFAENQLFSGDYKGVIRPVLGWSVMPSEEEMEP
jgi:lipopolysaccharide transport system ATP-binding protein